MELAVRATPTRVETDGPSTARAWLAYLLFYLVATSAIGHALLPGGTNLGFGRIFYTRRQNKHPWAYVSGEKHPRAFL